MELRGQVERSLFQNFLHGKQLEYRNYPPVETPSSYSLPGAAGATGAGTGASSVGSSGGGVGGVGGGVGGGGSGSENRRSDAWENVSTSTKVSGAKYVRLFVVVVVVANSVNCKHTYYCT